MSFLKININHRNYSDWCILNADTLLPLDKTSLFVDVDVEFEPIQHKLFSGDVFTFENGIVTICNSSVRTMQDIPAVLILADNKTYGRKKGIKGKLLYKCVPDDVRLPVFLVPYEIKHVGFSKVFSNLYVTINFSDWSGNSLPLATLTQTIGPVDVLENFYEYQLYCKSLNASMQKLNDATKMLVKSDHEAFIHTIFSKHPLIEDRTSPLNHVFSIDPLGSSDFDDAFSIKLLDDNTVQLSIYIANVTIIMDALNLWPSVSKRIATIYLPDKKRPMLPTILSDCLCSLQKGSCRFALSLDLILEKDGTIISTKYSNCLIRVNKNYVYEEPDLLKNASYILLLDTARLLSKKYKYINHVAGSHDVVAYLMILMNYFSAKKLLKEKVGIFRSTVVNPLQTVLPNDVPEDVGKFIKIWNSSFGQYIVVNDDLSLINTAHSLLDMDAYIHITSPIRRLVDLLNIVKFQEVFQLSITLSQSASEFYTHWTDKIDYINVTMRAIKKIQNDCSLLDTFNKGHVLDKLYDGYCFDKIARSDGLFQYIVFLPELKLTSKVTIREDLNNYQLKKYKLFLFNNEERFKKKIRLQLCN